MKIRFGIQAYFIYLVCIFWGLPGFVFAGDADLVTDIEIIVHCPAEKQAFWESIASSFIPVKAGDAYSIEVMNTAVNSLKGSQLFEYIHVPDPEKTEKGIKLSFELTPFSRISDIRIRDAFPVFEQEVLNTMTIKAGGIYKEPLVADQKARVENLFKRQGFYAPTVNMSAVKEGNFYVVEVDIDKGPFHQIREVRFQGNDNTSNARLKFVTGSWRTSLLPWQGNRFTEKEMKDDVKKVTQLYRKKGYADVSVTAEQVPVKACDDVDVVFTIDEGPLYEIDFQGNDALYKWSLKKDLLLKKDGNKNNFALKKSLRNIEKRYASKGFPDAKVRKEKTDLKDPEVRQINILIDEGRKYKVSEMKISGADTLPIKEVQKSILTREKKAYDQEVLEEDLKAVKAFYISRGFTKAGISKRVKISDAPDKDEKQVAVEIIVKEGPRTKVEQVKFQGLTAVSRERALGLMTLKQGGWYDKNLVDDDTIALQQAVAQKGYPHVKVTADTDLSKDNTHMQLIYQVDQGPHVTVGNIFYAGNLRLRDQELTDEMEIAPGDPFSVLKVVDSRRNIQGLSAVDTVRIRSAGLKTRKPEADLIVEVSEKKPYYMELAGGYDTSRHLYTETGIGDKDFLGRNLNAEAGLELSQIGYGMDLSLTEPRFLSTRFASTSKVYTEKSEEFNKDYGVRSFGVSQTFLRSFRKKKLSLSLGVSYEYRDQYLTVDRELEADEEDDFGVRNIGQISTGLTWRTTDSFVHPRKGVFASTTVDVYKGIDSNVDDFYKYGLEMRYYLPLFDDLVLAVRGKYGYMEPYGGNTHIADDQLYFLGGASTVRGFDENMLRYDSSDSAVGGRTMMLGSVEARYDLGMGYEVALFFDSGAVSRMDDETVPEGFRNSVGIGLRRHTPVGPISLLYGWKLDPDPGEDKGCFHFSLGYTF